MAALVVVGMTACGDDDDAPAANCDDITTALSTAEILGENGEPDPDAFLGALERLELSDEEASALLVRCRG